MSKSKDIEKQLEKRLEKKLEKEHIKFEKIEKHEFKEPFKEKIEHKEKLEKIQKEHKFEIKEFKNEKIEHKEGGKEGPYGLRTFQSLSAEASIAKPKEQEKAYKEIEKIKPEKELKLEKHEAKEHKHEKLEIKDKPEKFEKHEKDKYEKENIKTEKHEKEHIKIEIKEIKIEKLEQSETVKDFTTEGPPGKEQVEGPIDPGGEVINPFKAGGTAEERLADLEDALSRLSHFIGVNLRPDLSAGALNREPDVAKDKSGQTPAPPAKPDDKTKKS